MIILLESLVPGIEHPYSSVTYSIDLSMVKDEYLPLSLTEPAKGAIVQAVYLSDMSAGGPWLDYQSIAVSAPLT